MAEEGFCDVDFSDASDDCDRVEFYDAKIVTARKGHICTECDTEIAVGERHQRMSYKFEGKFQVDRWCAPCHEAAGEFGFNMLGGLLWEHFADQWDEGAHLQACLNRLTSARAKAHMREQWSKWQEQRAQQRRKALEARQAADAVRRSRQNPS